MKFDHAAFQVSDINKSIDYCRKAYEIDPTRIDIVKEYGISLITRGLWKKNSQDIEKGKQFLRKIPALPRRFKTDSIDIEHSKLMLADISLCPGYSRDQQQDINANNIRKMENNLEEDHLN